ncbi:phosphatidylserine decarboxylase [Malassezia equina]|uniref:Phosphatidylserine decarboxylase proenzyme 1, mitochondrial n=1 Tax=Malassezia equina TaxID=1381935 RepID=A0AAF0IZ35_9BASI|nr:phosphatidylserine decarboxylase [Malassezia equina]
MWGRARPRVPPLGRGPGVVSRAYARDPNEAVHAATTVRGHRAERARLQSLHQAPRRASIWTRAWRTWRETPLKWSPIPIFLGGAVLVAVQARREHQQRREAPVVDEHGQPVRRMGPWTMYILGVIPFNAISRTWGWFNDLTLPVWFRPYGFQLYARLFGCHLDEMKEKDLRQYANLADFFVRELEPGARPISPSLLVSPADGKVLHLGVVEGDRVEQVKGLTYSLGSLLGYHTPAHAHDDALLDDARTWDVADERHFAQVNGIDYTLEELLGDKRRPFRLHAYLQGWAKGAWRWMSLTLRGKRSAYQHVPTHEVQPTELAREQANKEDAELSEQGDAGIPTADSAETLSHYAQVAMDMGSASLPGWNTPGPRTPGHRLYFCVIYLSPGDYHRFHSPAPWVVELRRHFRGELYSVAPSIAASLPNLFVVNERVALLGRWRHGFFSMTPIGATNVGSIQIHFDRNLRTNQHTERQLAGSFTEATYHAASRLLGGQPLAPGDEMGCFRLGSTVVLVFEAPESFRFHCRAGDRVQVGEALGDVA